MKEALIFTKFWTLFTQNISSWSLENATAQVDLVQRRKVQQLLFLSFLPLSFFSLSPDIQFFPSMVEFSPQYRFWNSMHVVIRKLLHFALLHYALEKLLQFALKDYYILRWKFYYILRQCYYILR